MFHMVTVKEGGEIPFWHGWVKLNKEMYGVDFCLIPFNYLYRIWYRILKKDKLREQEAELLKILNKIKAEREDLYLLGYKDGVSKGIDIGSAIKKVSKLAKEKNNGTNNNRDRTKNGENRNEGATGDVTNRDGQDPFKHGDGSSEPNTVQEQPNSGAPQGPFKTRQEDSAS